MVILGLISKDRVRDQLECGNETVAKTSVITEITAHCQMLCRFYFSNIFDLVSVQNSVIYSLPPQIWEIPHLSPNIRAEGPIPP